MIEIIWFVLLSFIIGPIIQAQTVTDSDGNVYNTVTIGTHVWMKENLKTTRYNDGTAIPNITDNTEWEALTTGAYCDYDNNPSNSTIYGRLYNWYTVDNDASTKVASNGGKNVCPLGWHVPTKAEWTILTEYLNSKGYGYQGSGGDIAKSMANTSGWTESDIPGTVGNDQASNNRSGFTALPGGFRSNKGVYDRGGWYSDWWSSTRIYKLEGWYGYMYYSGSIFTGSITQNQWGFAVRCLRDQLATDITDPSASIIEIYPNPVSGILTVDNKNENFQSISILNSQGVLLTKVKSPSPIQQFDFSTYAPGLYFLEFIKSSFEIPRLKVVKR